jgi:hypothetical protein
MMKKSVSVVVAVLLAGSASLAVAQYSAGTGNLSGSTGWNYQTPSLVNTQPAGQIASTPSPAPTIPFGNCDPAGCWGANGTRYTRGAGNFMFGTNGKICQMTVPGAPMMCN